MATHLAIVDGQRSPVASPVGSPVGSVGTPSVGTSVDTFDTASSDGERCPANTVTVLLQHNEADTRGVRSSLAVLFHVIIDLRRLMRKAKTLEKTAVSCKYVYNIYDDELPPYYTTKELETISIKAKAREEILDRRHGLLKKRDSIHRAFLKNEHDPPAESLDAKNLAEIRQFERSSEIDVRLPGDHVLAEFFSHEFALQGYLAGSVTRSRKVDANPFLRHMLARLPLMRARILRWWIENNIPASSGIHVKFHQTKLDTSALLAHSTALFNGWFGQGSAGDRNGDLNSFKTYLMNPWIYDRAKDEMNDEYARWATQALSPGKPISDETWAAHRGLLHNLFKRAPLHTEIEFDALNQMQQALAAAHSAAIIIAGEKMNFRRHQGEFPGIRIVETDLSQDRDHVDEHRNILAQIELPVWTDPDSPNQVVRDRLAFLYAERRALLTEACQVINYGRIADQERVPGIILQYVRATGDSKMAWLENEIHGSKTPIIVRELVRIRDTLNLRGRHMGAPQYTATAAARPISSNKEMEHQEKLRKHLDSVKVQLGRLSSSEAASLLAKKEVLDATTSAVNTYIAGVSNKNNSLPKLYNASALGMHGPVRRLVLAAHTNLLERAKEKLTSDFSLIAAAMSELDNKTKRGAFEAGVYNEFLYDSITAFARLFPDTNMSWMRLIKEETPRALALNTARLVYMGY